LRSTEGSRSRLFALLGVIFVFALATAAGASAQDTTTTTPTETVPGAPEGAPLSGTATLLPNGTALAPPNAPFAIQNAIRAANRIHTRTYIWGGGHRRWKSKGYDCSGAVSYVLHAAGLLSAPLVSGQLARWGYPGTGGWITVFANRHHTFMVIAGLRFDTSPVGETLNQGRGPRWRVYLRSATGYAIRYYPSF
jgi:hypothetical protein